ncbi:MAG: ATP synthase F0 subunit B [Clostridiales bacterium]|nr:ATP synthase F0 subunit B [Clostridiales bacterium]MCD7828000.1 ATP synthase F0 subunit B [Clostridiales bacterium]
MNYEEIIEKIEDILEEGKPSLGGGGKIKIDGDAIRQCIEELSSSIPAEMIQARKIVAQRREVFRDAQNEASKIIQDAQTKAEEMIEEHEITKGAREAAMNILNEANAEADKIREQANADATERENSAKKWAYEMRTSASDFAKSILGECDTYLTNDITHYTQSQDNVRLALSRLENVAIKHPSDE